MIERQVVQGRPATISYMTDNFEPSSKDAATLIKVVFDDGEVLFLTPKVQHADSVAG